MDLGDEGPYQNMLEALADLRLAIDPQNIPTAFRKDARRLRSILKGVLERVKNFALRRFQGLAQLIYTEICGHGGLAVFRRMDSHSVAIERADGRAAVGGGGSGFGGGGGLRRGGGGGGFRGFRGRGAQRGGGGRGARPDLADVQCYGCYQRGHLRNNCPERNRAPAPNNAILDA